MKLLLTSAGITNDSILDALLDLLGRPITECRAVVVPTALHAMRGGHGFAALLLQDLAAAVRVAREHGVRVEEPVVLHDLFSLRVHLLPAPVVARIPTWITRLRAGTDWIAREVAIAGFLARDGAPVVAPSAELPAGPHERDGFTMSFWTHVTVDLDRTVSADDCAAMLPDLHAALVRYPGQLPALGASAVDLPRWLGGLETGTHGLPDEVIARVHAAAQRFGPILDGPTHTWRSLHGDAHAGNLLATADGLLWNDFEEACRGPAEWDLSTIGDDDAVHAHHRPDPAALSACRQLRTLQIALCLIHLREPFADLPGWDDAIRGTPRSTRRRPLRQPHSGRAQDQGKEPAVNRRGMRTGREEDAALVEAAITGDEVAFAAMTARYRRESQVHCYRMLGSFDESQDLRHLPCRRRWPASDVAFQAARYQARRAVDTAAALKTGRAACGKDHRP